MKNFISKDFTLVKSPTGDLHVQALNVCRKTTQSERTSIN